MSKRGKVERKKSADLSRRPWLYAAFGVFGGLGAGLLVAAFVLFQEGGKLGGERGDSGGALGASGFPGRANAPGSVSAAAPAVDAEAQGAGFPAQYDTLGMAVGPEDATVVVREFADYQCGYCAQFASVTQRVREEYVESERVRFVFFDLPITSQHPNAMAAAEAARCAGRQGTYWEMHDALFEKQPEWADAGDPLPRFREYAGRIGIDPAALAQCVGNGETRTTVQRNMQFAQALGIGSTPTIVIGNQALAGARSWAEVRSLIEERLAASN